MGVTLQGTGIRKERITPAAPPALNERIAHAGFDHRSFNAPLFRAGGWHFQPPSECGSLWSGHSVEPCDTTYAAGPVFGLAGLPRETTAPETLVSPESFAFPGDPHFVCLLFAASAPRPASPAAAREKLPRSAAARAQFIQKGELP